MNGQLDLAGNVTTDAPLPVKRWGNRFETMQDLHGLTEGQKCKDCKHLFKRQYGRNYYKCSLWHITGSSASDVRIGKTACGKFEPRDEKMGGISNEI